MVQEELTRLGNYRDSIEKVAKLILHRKAGIDMRSSTLFPVAEKLRKEGLISEQEELELKDASELSNSIKHGNSVQTIQICYKMFPIKFPKFNLNTGITSLHKFTGTPEDTMNMLKEWTAGGSAPKTLTPVTLSPTMDINEADMLLLSRKDYMQNIELILDNALKMMESKL